MKKFTIVMYPARKPVGHPDDNDSWLGKICIPIFAKDYGEAFLCAQALYEEHTLDIYEQWPGEEGYND
jgi:hypothetical protein